MVLKSMTGLVGWVVTQQKILSEDEMVMLGHDPTYEFFCARASL